MESHATCKNHDCEKKDECKRYMVQGVAEVEYKWICRNDNRYHWFWEMEKMLEKSDKGDNQIDSSEEA